MIGVSCILLLVTCHDVIILIDIIDEVVCILEQERLYALQGIESSVDCLPDA